jgi:hypothetical protein
MSTDTARPKRNGAATQSKPKRATKRAAKKKSADEMMLEMWKKIYRDHHPQAKG